MIATTVDVLIKVLPEMAWAIVGIVIGSVAFVAIVTLCCVLLIVVIVTLCCVLLIRRRRMVCISIIYLRTTLVISNFKGWDFLV